MYHDLWIMSLEIMQLCQVNKIKQYPHESGMLSPPKPFDETQPNFLCEVLK